jgi:hypothetical protein
MSRRSQARIVKPKGSVRNFKIVESVTRRGRDTLKLEEVMTPRRESKKASSSRQTNESSSPAKRPKLVGFDAEPLQCDFGGPHEDGQRQTLVLILPLLFPPIL